MTRPGLRPRFLIACATGRLALAAAALPAATPPGPVSPNAATTHPAAASTAPQRRPPAADVPDGNLAPATPVSPPKPESPPAAAAPADDREGRIHLGSTLAQRGDYVGAEAAFRQVLDSSSASTANIKNALLGLAHMHRQQGALTKAAAIYERYLKDYTGDERVPEALLDLGRTLRSLGVYKLALARFYSVINSTLKLPGGSFDRYQALAKTAQFEIAETHFLAGEFTEAAKFYTRLGLLELAAGDRGQVQFKAAYAQRLQGDLAVAVVALRSFLDQWPQDANVPEARYLLALTLRELNRPQEAFVATIELLQTAKSVCAADPKRWTYWQRRTGNQLANDFFEAGNTVNAQVIYAGLLELSPEPAWRLPTTYQLGLCYERLGQIDRARASYRNILDTATPTPPPEVAELVRMAGWRLDHLAWRERTAQQLNSLLETTTGKQAATMSVPLSQTAATP